MVVSDCFIYPDEMVYPSTCWQTLYPKLFRYLRVNCSYRNANQMFVLCRHLDRQPCACMVPLHVDFMAIAFQSWYGNYLVCWLIFGILCVLHFTYSKHLCYNVNPGHACLPLCDLWNPPLSVFVSGLFCYSIVRSTRRCCCLPVLLGKRCSAARSILFYLTMPLSMAHYRYRSKQVFGVCVCVWLAGTWYCKLCRAPSYPSLLFQPSIVLRSIGHWLISLCWLQSFVSLKHDLPFSKLRVERLDQQFSSTSSWFIARAHT